MRTIKVALLFLGLACASAPSQAANCNSVFVNSVLSRMNTLVSTSGNCRKMLNNDNAQAGRVCTTCRGTISKLLTLQGMYNKNGRCFREDPKISARFNELWHLKKDVDKLQRMCG